MPLFRCSPSDVASRELSRQAGVMLGISDVKSAWTRSQSWILKTLKPPMEPERLAVTFDLVDLALDKINDSETVGQSLMTTPAAAIRAHYSVYDGHVSVQRQRFFRFAWRSEAVERLGSFESSPLTLTDLAMHRAEGTQPGSRCAISESA